MTAPSGSDAPVAGQVAVFWKSHAEFFCDKTGLPIATTFQYIFGVDLTGARAGRSEPGPPDPRAAAPGAAEPDDAATRPVAAPSARANTRNDDVAFVYEDEGALPSGLAATLGHEPDAGTYTDELVEVCQAVEDILALIDANGDGEISEDEMVDAVQEAFAEEPALSISDLAKVLVTINGIPGVEIDEFVWT